MYRVIIDIETTGLDILRDTPIQIAAIVLNDSLNEVSDFSFFVNPFKRISQKVESITGITNEELLKHGYIDSVATKRYMDFIWKWQPCTLVGHNLISFDFPMLTNWLQTYFQGKFKQPPIASLVDTMHLASIKFKTRKWLKLEDCGKRLDIIFNKEQLHNAIADVRLTKAVYLALLD